MEPFNPRKDLLLIRDPIHNYIECTVARDDRDEKAEYDLLTNRWVQRLKRLRQLQSAWVAYPASDNHRFQHSLGVMHLAGEFANTIYRPFYERLGRSMATPSVEYIVEIARLAGLLHDIGHGPFGHLLDDCFLTPEYGLNHELITLALLETPEIESILRGIRRCGLGNGELRAEETIARQDIAYLIRSKEDDRREPYWKALRRVLQGVYSVDIIDFLARDSYFCGAKEHGAIDSARLIRDSFISLGQPTDGKAREDELVGLALHKRSIPALQGFLYARMKMFEAVYWHREAGVFETLARQELGPALKGLSIITMQAEAVKDVFTSHNLEGIAEFVNQYYGLDDWRFWSAALNNDDAHERAFWQELFAGNHGWKEAYCFTEPTLQGFPPYIDPNSLKRCLEKKLGEAGVEVEGTFLVDCREPLKIHPRKEDPIAGERGVLVYDESNDVAREMSLDEMLKSIPTELTVLRVYCNRSDLMGLMAAKSRECVNELSVGPRPLTTY